MKKQQSKSMVKSLSKNKRSHKQINTSSLQFSPSNLRDRLKKGINITFMKKHHQQDNHQIKKKNNFLSHHSSSILINNRLTKSYFSLTDSITHKANLRETLQSIKTAVKSIMGNRKNIVKSFRQISKSKQILSSYNKEFFQAKINLMEKIKNQIVNKQAFPSIQLKIVKAQTQIINRQEQTDKHHKFKLLFRQKHGTYKSASEKKIQRIQTKITDLKKHKKLLQSMMTKQKQKTTIKKSSPKGIIISEQKILKLIFSLIKNIELYFNMYHHNNIVGGHLKKIDGYGKQIKQLFMLDENRAKRMVNPEEIKSKFWVYHYQDERPQYFGEQDLALYNTLNNYQMKAQKRYMQTSINFNNHQQNKIEQQQSSLKSLIQKYQQKFVRHEQITKINKFISQRQIFTQQHRQQFMNQLQKRGVKLNLIERSKGLILRLKQKARSKYFNKQRLR